MVALGRVPRRCEQLCSLLGPGPGPEERVLLLGFRDNGLQGSPAGSRTTPGCTVTLALRPVEVRAKQTQQEHRTPGCAHAPSLYRTQPVTLLPGTAGRARQAWGSATQSQWARSAAGKQAPAAD